MKIAFGMGLRRSEICALKVSDIDFYKNQIKVQRAMVKTPEKKWILKTPKTKAGKRTLSIPDFLIPDLKQAVQVKEPNDLIFSLNPVSCSFSINTIAVSSMGILLFFYIMITKIILQNH